MTGSELKRNFDFTKSSERQQFVESVGLDKKDASGWFGKFYNFLKNSKARGCSCQLTFDQYLNMALDAGLMRYDQIGRAADQYCVGRYGDKGDYVPENCRFITNSQNAEERLMNGGCASAGMSLRGRNKFNCPGQKARSDKMLGKTKENDEVVMTRAVKMSGRTKETHSGVATSALKNSKTFVLIDPSGKEYRGINLNQFCKDHGLNQGSMASVCRGQTKHHKGWRGIYIYAQP